MLQFQKVWPILFFIGIVLCQTPMGTAQEVDFRRDIQPLFVKYCAGCHNDSEMEGKLSLASFASLQNGSESGPVIAAGDVRKSLIAQVLRDDGDSHMPPKEEPQPSLDEIETIERWIATGAKGPTDDLPLAEKLQVPMVPSTYDGPMPITAMVVIPSSKRIAVGKYGKIQFRNSETSKVELEFDNILGKVNQLRLSPDGQRLVAASGVTGIGGQVTIIDLQSEKIERQFEAQRDTLYAAVLSPDNRWLVAAGYDRQAILFDRQSGEKLRTFDGHNGAIYDLDLDSTGQLLATASADETIKLWNMSTGQRLDTLGQGEAEQYAVRFHPHGDQLAGAGADRRLRLWKIASKDQAMINPILQSAFAHEEAILALAFSRDGQRIATAGEDRKLKLWSVPELNPLGEVGQSDDTPSALGFDEQGAMLWLASLDGKAVAHRIVAVEAKKKNSDRVRIQELLEKDPRWSLAVNESVEAEPNDRISQAQALPLPAKAKGVIRPVGDENRDEDWYSFDALTGQSWLIQIIAAREGSPLDSRIEVYDSQGKPVLRTRLQAMRESYFTFRGKSSDVVDDFRLHNWQDMELNQWLYSNGEVVKLWLYPRGPDSGFKVYPGHDIRYTYFDTTATSHALGEVAWIVRELNDGEEPLPNGLPVFPVYYENDDDGFRKHGKDSVLHFIAPKDDRYLVRVRDARGLSSDEHRYTLSITPPKPDFQVRCNVTELSLAPASGNEFEVTAVREDGYQGPIEIMIHGLPEGYIASQPLTIEAGQEKALGLIMRAGQSESSEIEFDVQLSARATIAGTSVERKIEKPIRVKKIDGERVRFSIMPSGSDQPANASHPLTLKAGETISAKVIAERGKFEGDIGFGTDDCGRNLPHGVIVDNIGLNGLLIPAGQNQQDLFLTAAPWLEPQERLFHLRAFIDGSPTTVPVLLRIE